MFWKQTFVASSMLLAGVNAVPAPAAQPARTPYQGQTALGRPGTLPGAGVAEEPTTNQGPVSLASAAYTLQDTYNSGNWLNMFQVQSIGDPTGGFVTYVTQSQAQSQGLIKNIGNQVFVGVDNSTVLNPNGPGRNSVRLMSNKAYNHGLIIADFAHIPGSDCGSWPAFWMVGPNWPYEGEIDIIEGVNTNTFNQMTLHTGPGCTVTVGAGGQSGTSGSDPNCGDGGGYNGCGVISNVGTSFGTAFNAANGGVYATQWTSTGIKVWYWMRSQIPSDITSGNPNPNNWGQPQANFGGCAFDNFFKDMNIIFDITFCGAWAGAVWGSSPCANQNPNCNNYVAANPHAYNDAYWLVNSIEVYE